MSKFIRANGSGVEQALDVNPGDDKINLQMEPAWHHYLMT